MSDLDRITKKSLGELLVDEGVISTDQLRDALAEQERTGDLLGETLIKHGYTSEVDIAKALCEQFGKPYCKASMYDISKDVLALLPPRLMVEHCFIPLDRFGDVLILAMGALLDLPTVNQIRKLSSCQVEVFVSTTSDVKNVLRKCFPDLFDPVTLQPIFHDQEYTASFRIEMTEEEEDDMGGTTRELVGVADEDSDWEALFEEAERNVLNELKNKRTA